LLGLNPYLILRAGEYKRKGDYYMENRRGNMLVFGILIFFLITIIIFQTFIIFDKISKRDFGIYTGIKRIYQKNIYDCDNMSEDFVKYLHNLGYDASVIVGYDYKISDKTKHAWVQVEGPLMIEPQTGQIINISSFDENYKMTGWYEYR